MKLNTDQNHVKKIIESIYKNNGYCPCVVDKNEDTICPCKDMLENLKCHCKLFISE